MLHVLVGDEHQCDVFAVEQFHFELVGLDAFAVGCVFAAVDFEDDVICCEWGENKEIMWGMKNYWKLF